MSLSRRCSRTACPSGAVATLTYVYADQSAVLGPLATYAEPHTYDLCAAHADRLSAPRGWAVVRLVSEYDEPPRGSDDLLALADAVREGGRRSSRRQAARPEVAPTGSPPGPPTGPPEPGRRGHLSVLRDR